MIVSSPLSNNAAPITPSALRSRGAAILAFAGFGAWWAGSALRDAPLPLVEAGYLLVAAITLALLFAAICLLRSSQGLKQAAETSSLPRRRTAGIFIAVLVAEVIAINFAALLLASHHLRSGLLPLIAIIVGLHFYPLARLFRTPYYDITATVMTLAGVVGLAALLAGCPTPSTLAAVAAVCAFTLWATAFAAWQRSREAIGRAR